MKSLRVVLLVFVLMITSGCSHYPDLSGKVIDNATGKPIEGALVVARWSKKHGFGLTYHTLSMITETLTDKEGVFSITSTPNDPFVEPPQMIIYKEGYIPWRNDSIFPSSNTVKNYEWNNNLTYKLEAFSTDKYSIEQLSDFLDYGMTQGIGEAPMFHKLISKMQSAAHDENKRRLNANKP